MKIVTILKNKKILYSLPILFGVLIGLTINSVNNKERAVVQSPVSSGYKEISLTTSSNQSPETYILSSQSLLAKAIETSKDNQAEAETKDKNERIIQLINESINTINQAISSYPNDARCWAQRAKIYQTVTQYMPEGEEVALSAWQMAAKLDPYNTDYCQSIAKLYLKKDEVEAAIYYLQKGVETNPTDPNLIKQLAEYQTKAGMLKQAKINYQKLVSLLIDSNQRETIQNQIVKLDKLIAQMNSDELTEPSNYTPEEIILPESPPLLEARHLANNIIIASPEETEKVSQSGSLETNALSGTETIVSGTTEVTVYNNNLTEETQVYLTPETEIKNLVLTVKKKVVPNPLTNEDGYFVVKIKETADKDISFKWWIIEK